MNRSLFLYGIPLVIASLVAGGLISTGLYGWEQAARQAAEPVPVAAALETPTPAPAGASGGSAATSASTGDAGAGRSVYVQLCDACHPGGGAGLGPALSGADFEASFGGDEALAAIIRDGTSGMPAFPSSRVSDTQLLDLVAFIRTLGPLAGGAGAGAVFTEVPVLGQMSWTGSYARDVQPIFDAYCVRCHGETMAENGLRLDSYANVMQGTRGGSVVSPGQAGGSTLVWVVQGLAAPELRMPHSERPLSPNRIQNIVLWINAGALDD